MQQSTKILVAATAALLLEAAPPAGAAEPYDITVVAPLTGGASFVGLGQKDTLDSLAAYVNKTGGIQGRDLRFTFRDDQSTPQVAVQLTNEVLPSHPAVIMGSSIVAMCLAMAPLMQDGPVQYCLSPAIHPTRGSYVFSSSMSTPDDLRAVIRFFRDSGWKRIGVLTGTDVGGQDIDAKRRIARGAAL